MSSAQTATFLPDAAATIAAGAALAASLRAGDVIALTGGLGAGKTHLSKGLIHGLGSAAEVTSPTFSLVHEFRDARLPAFHFDFYRMRSEAEVIALGWDDYLDSGGVCIVEWADLFPSLLPAHTRWLTLEPRDGARLLSERPPAAAQYIETFPALTAHEALCAHAFVQRVPGVDTSQDKAEVLQRLAPHHSAAAAALGFAAENFYTAEQVHGADIAVVNACSPHHSLNVDGLMTSVPGLLLGIHVADCGPVYLIDPARRAIALLHSGKKGSEKDITGHAVRMMQEHYGSRPADLTVQLGPCIRVPQYDVDFPAMIYASALAAGVPAAQIHDCRTCTALSPDRYYSYRRELGKTGRLLALLGLRP